MADLSDRGKTYSPEHLPSFVCLYTMSMHKVSDHFLLLCFPATSLAQRGGGKNPSIVTSYQSQLQPSAFSLELRRRNIPCNQAMHLSTEQL